ncbi:MAG: hypothetical protein M0Q92_02310 [Methanoregula sp.]|jgi:hypothetical protein|nr:hypothetical protein [Methanoregula sp.]
MFKKIVLCAVIALILVTATVMAAGNGGPGTGAAAGQGQCLSDGQTCTNPSCTQGSANQMQYRQGARMNGENGASVCLNGQCTQEEKQTRTMLRLQDGSCGCRNVPVTQT